MMEMTNVYLPITGNWHRFFNRCEKDSSVSKKQAAINMVEVAREIVSTMDKEIVDKNGKSADKEMKYEHDPWMWLADWSRPKKYSQWPKWYWTIFQTRAGGLEDLSNLDAESVKLLSREIPRLFGLCYGPYPLMHLRAYGWGFLVPREKEVNMDFDEVELDGDRKARMPVRDIYELINANKIETNDVLTRALKPATQISSFDFYRLPHPSGQKQNVGTPFTKSTKLEFDNFDYGIISPTRYKHILKNFLETRNLTRFWGNYRDRYQEQLSVWLDEEAECGAIAAPVIPAGTVTRRATHKLWLVSANPKKEIIGSELKSMVQCTPGWNLVGADVDSQEQWIAALFGDSMHDSKRAGATAFSNMLLAGNKVDKTDLHSVVAQQVGINREQAKVLNYARLYGSGKKHAEEFLKTQGITATVANALATKLFEKTKGKAGSYYELTSCGHDLFTEYQRANGITEEILSIDGRSFVSVDYDKLFNFEHWLQAKKGVQIRSIIMQPPVQLYRGGYESWTFNFLSLNSNKLSPETPVLKCRLSEALEPFPQSGSRESRLFNQMYKRTIINWFVQSSAVDFLHMLLISMRWLCTQYEIPARFVISIHDEVRYLVPSEHKYRCALALMLSNMYVRAAISEAMSIKELPRSVAFFSQVDIDTVLRKEVDMECQTPDGKIVEKGEALDIEEIVRRTGGSLQMKEQTSI